LLVTQRVEPSAAAVVEIFAVALVSSFCLVIEAAFANELAIIVFRIDGQFAASFAVIMRAEHLSLSIDPAGR
jgi:hypothetical protein